ncbi:RPM1-interacting protein 4 (RIN4) family protein [Medicago truncatula]|uniref:RPM1-interacting protein 4 (RIN4) family protein n=2 Tax=Medicago truncatula TaxID=3880 RepID=G7ILR2_MEDTR|nr:RPM1-interacting protein 4 (RIN4) family protein [Medicago truncatula]
MENPEIFNKHVNVDEVKPSHTYSHKASSTEKGSHEVPKNNSTHHLHRRRSRGSKGSFTSEFGSEKSHIDHSVINKTSQSEHKRSVSKGIGSNTGSFSSSNHRSESRSFNDHGDHRAVAIPEFGKWDVTDPKSGEGYTVMFSKIKEEKQIMSSRISGLRTTPHNNGSNIKNQHDGSSFNLSKYCCCLSTSESK